MSRRKPIRYDPSHDLYGVLGVLPSATDDEIRRSFRQRAKEVHPDLNRDNAAWAHQQFQQLNDAYDILNDSALRAEYDTKRRLFTRERGPDGIAWWERPNPATGPRMAGDATNRTSSQGAESYAVPPMPPRRQTQPLRRKKADMPSYQMLFIVSFMLLVGSICASMTRMRVDGPESPTALIDGPQPTLAVSPDTGVMCMFMNAMITDPPYAAEVAGRFSIKGTASGPHFISYHVDIRPADAPSSGTYGGITWTPLTPIDQTHPVDNGVLVPETMTASLPPGNYLIRLAVKQDDGTTLPCWWPILKTR